jgi:hypothetical protein
MTDTVTWYLQEDNTGNCFFDTYMHEECRYIRTNILRKGLVPAVNETKED